MATLKLKPKSQGRFVSLSSAVRFPLSLGLGVLARHRRRSGGVRSQRVEFPWGGGARRRERVTYAGARTYTFPGCQLRANPIPAYCAVLRHGSQYPVSHRHPRMPSSSWHVVGCVCVRPMQGGAIFVR